MQRHFSRRRIAAFTLVELLVVVGIIAVLISVLLPALNRAREQAKIIACASNERQIMQMMAMYAATQKGWLPPFSYAANGALNPGAPPTDALNAWVGWDEILMQTVMADSLANRNNSIGQGLGGGVLRYQVFICPDDELPRDPLQLKYLDAPPRSYAINQARWGWGLGDCNNAGPGSGHAGPLTAPGPFGSAIYKMPWSGGCPSGSSGQLGSTDGQFVQQCKIAQVPSWIWILGENQGTTGLWGLPSGANAPSIGAQNAWNAVFGTFECAFLDGSPARFHSRDIFNRAGGNYSYPDGHVEFIKWKDTYQVRADTPYRATDANPTIFNDHWKWYTTR